MQPDWTTHDLFATSLCPGVCEHEMIDNRIPALKGLRISPRNWLSCMTVMRWKYSHHFQSPFFPNGLSHLNFLQLQRRHMPLAHFFPGEETKTQRISDLSKVITSKWQSQSPDPLSLAVSFIPGVARATANRGQAGSINEQSRLVIGQHKVVGLWWARDCTFHLRGAAASCCWRNKGA